MKASSGAMFSVKLADLRRYIDEMPALSSTVEKVMTLCRRPDTSPVQLSQVIHMDPVITAKIMRLINSAYYGLPREVTSLSRAMILLGFNTIKNLVLSTAILNQFRQQGTFKVLNGDAFWRHCLCVGMTAKLIAAKRGVPKEQLEAHFVAGLIHDIGKIPLSLNMPDQYRMVLETAALQRHDLYLTEKKLMGMDHTNIGKWIIDKWRLHGGIGDAVIYHHALKAYHGENADVVYTVALADYTTNVLELGVSGNRYPEEIMGDLPESFRLSDKEFLDIVDGVQAGLEKAQSFLNAI